MQTSYKKILNDVDSDQIVDALAPYVTEARKARIDGVLSARLDGIRLAIESPSDINNALAAVRTAEILGVSTVYIIAAEGTAVCMKSVTQGAFYWVDIQFFASWAAFFAFACKARLTLAGGTPRASCELASVPVDAPLCIVVGNERVGLSAQAKQDIAVLYKVPMFGMTDSYNLSVSAALSLYELTQQKRSQLGVDTDLSTKQKTALKAKYYLNSVAPRLAEALLLRR